MRFTTSVPWTNTNRFTEPRRLPTLEEITKHGKHRARSRPWPGRHGGSRPPPVREYRPTERVLHRRHVVFPGHGNHVLRGAVPDVHDLPDELPAGTAPRRT